MRFHLSLYVLLFTFYVLIALLGFASISLAEEGKWTKKADMPTPRIALSTSVVNGKIYVIGGWDGSRRVNVGLYVYMMEVRVGGQVKRFKRALEVYK